MDNQKPRQMPVGRQRRAYHTEDTDPRPSIVPTVQNGLTTGLNSASTAFATPRQNATVVDGGSARSLKKLNQRNEGKHVTIKPDLRTSLCSERTNISIAKSPASASGSSVQPIIARDTTNSELLAISRDWAEIKGNTQIQDAEVALADAFTDLDDRECRRLSQVELSLKPVDSTRQSHMVLHLFGVDNFLNASHHLPLPIRATSTAGYCLRWPHSLWKD